MFPARQSWIHSPPDLIDILDRHGDRDVAVSGSIGARRRVEPTVLSTSRCVSCGNSYQGSQYPFGDQITAAFTPSWGDRIAFVIRISSNRTAVNRTAWFSRSLCLLWLRGSLLCLPNRLVDAAHGRHFCHAPRVESSLPRSSREGGHHRRRTRPAQKTTTVRLQAFQACCPILAAFVFRGPARMVARQALAIHGCSSISFTSDGPSSRAGHHPSRAGPFAQA